MKKDLNRIKTCHVHDYSSFKVSKVYFQKKPFWRYPPKICEIMIFNVLDFHNHYFTLVHNGETASVFLTANSFGDLIYRYFH